MEMGKEPLETKQILIVKEAKIIDYYGVYSFEINICDHVLLQHSKGLKSNPVKMAGIALMTSDIHTPTFT